jgi:hypothetical protein
MKVSWIADPAGLRKHIGDYRGAPFLSQRPDGLMSCWRKVIERILPNFQRRIEFDRFT